MKILHANLFNSFIQLIVELECTLVCCTVENKYEPFFSFMEDVSYSLILFYHSSTMKYIRGLGQIFLLRATMVISSRHTPVFVE